MRTIARLTLIGCSALAGACHHSSDDPPAQNNPPPGPTAGLDARPSNLTCVAPAKSGGNAGTTIALQRVFPNLTFTQPVAMLQAPGDNSRWFVLEKTGAARVFANTANVSTASTFAALTVNPDGEGGLLGMAFHPSFASNGQVFLSTTEGSNPIVSHIARYRVNPGGATLDTVNRDILLRVNQPFNNHKGGNI
ncbi:MAG TPA: PQQ-dependent sugar dehydrogenase, partial [Gammaproteobacteria bacterium]|nr:PQQ-dependent sugar dehydrogenase [Gammaproteobacteria bacterium]